MILIKKWWIRLIVSLILGGMVSEVGFLLTDGKVNLNALFPAAILFIILTLIYNTIITKRYYD
ncbi:hypothetical protein UMM65_16680 [Aureibaculum sp. 2210JD6-5]|uniref:hypothetical protein n=1 Tax=Aureibaculum sp. 2210JD6-5 TaxID=3103957 RepID=UPI002AAEE00A|nr:hypothetical protein [Aureibaculum sp. 2210JD6-5]MDY7396884.1 hypothetical protein [Aureibaculum sp. 2210JD6-5]